MSRFSFREHPVRWVLVLLVSGPVVLLCFVHVANNVAAHEIERRLVAIPLPPGTELVDSAWAVSRFAGAGNGTQYAGAVLVRSDLSSAALAALYNDGAQNARALGETDGRVESALRFGNEYDLTEPGMFVIAETGEPESALLASADVRGH